jgi:hypothetical protein
MLLNSKPDRILAKDNCMRRNRFSAAEDVREETHPLKNLIPSSTILLRTPASGPNSPEDCARRFQSSHHRHSDEHSALAPTFLQTSCVFRVICNICGGQPGTRLPHIRLNTSGTMASPLLQPPILIRQAVLIARALALSDGSTQESIVTMAQ